VGIRTKELGEHSEGPWYLFANQNTQEICRLEYPLLSGIATGKCQSSSPIWPSAVGHPECFYVQIIFAILILGPMKT